MPIFIGAAMIAAAILLSTLITAVATRLSVSTETLRRWVPHTYDAFVEYRLGAAHS